MQKSCQLLGVTENKYSHFSSSSSSVIAGDADNGMNHLIGDDSGNSSSRNSKKMSSLALPPLPPTDPSLSKKHTNPTLIQTINTIPIQCWPKVRLQLLAHSANLARDASAGEYAARYGWNKIPNIPY